MKRFFVTRPFEDALATSKALETRGHEAEIVPLLTIAFDEAASFADLEPQGLLISSANGIRAFAACDSRRDLDVVTVGPASADEAKALGFQTVTAAGGDVASLVALASHRYRPEKGVLCHVAGRAVAGNLAHDLQELGFEVVQRRAYTARAVETLPAALRRALMESDEGAEIGILFFSRRTTQCFVDLLRSEGLDAASPRIAAFCLSDAAAEPLCDISVKSVVVSPQKTQSALLDLCDIE